jgi:3-hydroxymyristoyl/3-hydroxydecanoyl-(acyl carrier protein) dehydratase
MERKTVFTLEEIYTLLPHRPPFLFVDRVVQFTAERLIMTERLIREDEPWFAGHFPGKPIMPGVLVTDALAQTAGLLWGFSKRARGGETSDTPEIFFLASVNIKFVSPALPGNTLLMRAESERQFGSLFTYGVEATAGRNVIAKGSLTLAMMEGKV